MRRTKTAGTDEAIAAACAAGDAASFRALFDRYREPMYRIAFRFCGDRDEADDLAQEIFVRAYRKIGTFRGESAFSTWLHRLATRVCLNGRRGRRPCESLDARAEEPAAPTVDPLSELIRAESARGIESAVAGLQDGLREAFILVAEGHSYVETAEILDLSVEAVRMRMSRARRELIRRLEKDAERRGGDE